MKPPSANPSPSGYSLSPEEVLAFTRALSRGLAGGHSLLACLQAMPEHSHSTAWQAVARDCAQQIQASRMFSEALARHPQSFDSFYVTMIHAGELHDRLEKALASLASQLQGEQRLEHQVQGVHLWLGAALGAILLALLTLARQHDLVPALWAFTPAARWWVLAGCLGVLLLGWRCRCVFRVQVDRVLLRLPLLGVVQSRFVVARCLRRMALLWSHDVPILQTLRVVAETAGHASVEQGFMAVAESVREGAPLDEPLRTLGLFPAPLGAVVYKEDSPYSAPNELLRLADDWEARVQDTLIHLMGRWVPWLVMLVIVLMGLLAAM